MSVADLLIAEGKYSGSRSLGTLCRHFGIVNQHAHRALGDARACLDFVRIARKLKEQN
jgi:DNA polymerase III epsilon subunit-like protein